MVREKDPVEVWENVDGWKRLDGDRGLGGGFWDGTGLVLSWF